LIAPDGNTHHLLFQIPAMNPHNPKVEGYVEKNGEILAICAGKRVLHLGCVGFTDSPVDLKIQLAKESLHQSLSGCCDCTGVDLDATSIAQLQHDGIFKNVITGDVEKLSELPAGLGLFDIIVAGDIIEHLSNPGAMLDGAKSLLKPGGQLIVSTPNAMGLPAYARFVLGTFREGGQHVLAFNSAVLFQLLTRHGYKILHIYTGYQKASKTNIGPFFEIGKWIFSFVPKFGGTLFFVATPDQALPGMPGFTAIPAEAKHSLY